MNLLETLEYFEDAVCVLQTTETKKETITWGRIINLF